MSGRSPRLISVKLGTRADTLPVGSTVKLNLNGTPWDWLVVHQGLPSADIYDASCNGTWLLLNKIYTTKPFSSSTNGRYALSTINTYLGNEFHMLFDDDVRSTIKQVKIPYFSGTTNQDAINGKNGLDVTVFLLSVRETGFSSTSVKPSIGVKLDYFLLGDSTAANKKRKTPDAKRWWCRDNGWDVEPTGGFGTYKTTRSWGVRPSIILPSNFRISADRITYPAA